jgi:uncharacterized protein (DUF1330 family)
MAAYLIAGNDVTDLKLMEDYVKAAGPTLGPFEGKLLAPDFPDLAAGGRVIHKEGDWKPSRIVIIEFPTMGKALAWYESPAYQSVIHLRLSGSVGSVLFAEGVP